MSGGFPSDVTGGHQEAALSAELASLESDIFSEEGRYLAGTAGDGNVVRGWQGLLATLQEDQIPDIDYIRFKSGERVFSKSSVSSKDVAEKYVDR